ncbi:MAG: radical SAM protein, partial [Chloroflexota bacterium]
MSLPAILNLLGDRLYSLPLGIVYLTDKCNSKCVTCDYWRYGQTFLSEDRARALAAEFDRLDTRRVLLSGGEPLLHPQWAERARTLAGGRRILWLLTAGLALEKYADQAVELCDTITVSLDAATPETYLAIRGVDAFEAVCAGVRAAVRRGAKVSLRCTVQRRNFRELPQLISLARDLDVHEISFLAVEVLTHVAFARREDVSRELALSADDLPVFDQILRRLSSDFPT